MHRLWNARDAFPTSADEYTQPVERLLQLLREELDVAWGKVDEGWAANNERMVKLGLSPRALDEGGVVKLNVGGSNVSLCWHLFAEIEGFEDSVLGALLEGVWGEGRIPRDAEGRVVLDQSPACIELVIHKMLRAKSTSTGQSGSAEERVPGRDAGSSVAIDELPGLMYTASVMGLLQYVPAHPNYAKIHGGSTTLEPFGLFRFSALIRQWVGSSTDEITLIYRATRDGFGSAAFTARCNQQSPKTIYLIRVSSDKGNDEDDSIVGGFTVHRWNGRVAGCLFHSANVFMFMLRDGSATRKDASKPAKWNFNPAGARPPYVVPDSDGPHFGSGGLATICDGTSGRCTVQTRQDDYFPDTGSSPSFLALNGKKVVDIEVYRYNSTPVPPATTAKSNTKPGGEVLTDAEPHDIDSFGRSIASSLMEERAVLDRAVKGMEAAGARVSAAVSALETVYGPSVAAGEQDAVVELNVRGTRMTTLRSTLQACPRSALAPMFDEERWPAIDKDKDEHGRRLIDCNPTCFSKILDVLRMRKRASWSAGTAGKEQEGSCGKCSGEIFIKKADAKAFGAAVNMYFPGCESFIMDFVHTV